VSGCCSGFPSTAERQFSEKIAGRDLRRYRRKGPDLSTRLLLGGLRAAGQAEGTLLDIGAGIGTLSFELLAAGVLSATTVDASAPYLDASRTEAKRRSLQERMRWHHGDFVVVADEVAAADVVTLDRVVCCYASVEPLLEAAARHARRCLAFSYPRDRWYVRAIVRTFNAVRRLEREAFRAFVRAPQTMESLVRSQGFTRLSRQTSLVWCADVYVRSGAPGASTLA
jgi:2-polyprenyl-3-methyl-5-hydroxy-6-metoxy-1,4-benzoquinol methylase